MLPAEGRNPEVIRWNWFSGLSQLKVNSGIVIRGLLQTPLHEIPEHFLAKSFPRCAILIQSSFVFLL